MRSADDSHSRRYFLSRLFKTGVLAAVTGVAGWKLYDKHGPLAPSVKKADTVLPSYAIDGIVPQVAIVHGSNRQKTVRQGLKAMGGIEAFIKKGDRVLIKVNAAFATPPVLSATTHPDLVAELVGLCLKAGATEVRVADNPINDPATCFELSGIGPAARAAVAT